MPGTNRQYNSVTRPGRAVTCSRRARGLCILVRPEGEKLSAEPPRSPMGADRGGEAAAGRDSRKLNEERREGSSAAALAGMGGNRLRPGAAWDASHPESPRTGGDACVVTSQGESLAVCRVSGMAVL